ncbi:drebrin-like [Hemicordylus capensis]|uniref:drebrin-like n=1 Tax=Hemicordylus capensis TaxID=884348 RepID=UPI002302B6F3|nr:drebrin-like [Hemicordylus capensis]
MASLDGAGKRGAKGAQRGKQSLSGGPAGARAGPSWALCPSGPPSLPAPLRQRQPPARPRGQQARSGAPQGPGAASRPRVSSRRLPEPARLVSLCRQGFPARPPPTSGLAAAALPPCVPRAEAAAVAAAKDGGPAKLPLLPGVPLASLRCLQAGHSQPAASAATPSAARQGREGRVPGADRCAPLAGPPRRHAPSPAGDGWLSACAQGWTGSLASPGALPIAGASSPSGSLYARRGGRAGQLQARLRRPPPAVGWAQAGAARLLAGEGACFFRSTTGLLAVGGLAAMSTRAVNLEKHRLALLAAKGDVVSGRAAASWALFAYEKSNELKLLDSGAGGPEELAKGLQRGSVMYGLCRLPDARTGHPLIVLINWVGENVPDARRQACAGHLPAIRAFFKEARLVVSAGRAEEVTQEGLQRSLALVPPPGGAAPKKAPLGDPQELVGTNYQKTNPALEVLRTQRDSFWAQAEREEAERREQERQRAQAERRRWERKRVEEERRETAGREQRIREKEQLLQEQRKQEAQLKAEERRREGPRWDSAGTAWQHSDTPRGSFQQRGRSGSASGAPELLSPTGGSAATPRRPFLRYQRSLTETAYIFRGPDPAGASLPCARPQAAAPPSPPVSPKPLAGSVPSPPAPSRTCFQAWPSSSSPEVGDQPHTALPELAALGLCEARRPSSPCNGHGAGLEPSCPGSPLQPHRASSPPLGSLRGSAAEGPVLQSDPSQAEATPAPALGEALLPPAHSSSPASFWSPDRPLLPHGNTLAEGPEGCGVASGWRPPAEAPLSPEKDPATGAAPPATPQLEPAPYSGHNGATAVQEGNWPGAPELGKREQEGLPAAPATDPLEQAPGEPWTGRACFLPGAKEHSG